MKLIAAFGLLVALSGCGSTSQFSSGYVSAGPKDEAAVDRGELNDAALAQIAIVQNPDFNGGLISPKAARKIQKYAISCQGQIDPQLAGAGQSGLNGAVGYGLGGLTTGLGAKAAFSGVSGGAYALYGAISSAGGGAVNGILTGSYAMASAKGECTRDFWSDIVKTDPDFTGTHVEVVYAGKATGDSKPPKIRR